MDVTVNGTAWAKLLKLSKVFVFIRCKVGVNQNENVVVFQLPYWTTGLELDVWEGVIDAVGELLGVWDAEGVSVPVAVVVLVPVFVEEKDVDGDGVSVPVGV